MTPSDLVKEVSEKCAQSFLHVSKIGAKKIQEFTIDCELLEDYNDNDITKSEKYYQLFKDLRQLSGPCLYYFTIISEHSTQDLVNSIVEYSITENSKSTPAIKKNIPESKILYVGKVKRYFWGRVIQHLGFYSTPRTQGLQLYYWTRANKLKLKLTVLEFESDMSDLLTILEIELAKQLKPIIGKHR